MEKLEIFEEKKSLALRNSDSEYIERKIALFYSTGT
ncbi:hypothetical protein CAEBREN_30358 [Caenorhabditis brenneri]|uniref:Uncharacterized protein n=1 Tax=Caenorhabditis brenneri TaxID=135651 RepID=G0PBP1_CAEBE|nr:hypothetical protein CAEBREN_30358 [Caenorhabditis brenneri]